MSSSTSPEEPTDVSTDSPTTTTDCNDTTVFRRMLAGAPYNAADPHVQYQAQVGRDKVHAINEAKDGKERMALLGKWAQMGPKGNAYVALPFFCEYVSTGKLSPVIVSLGGLYLTIYVLTPCSPLHYLHDIDRRSLI